MNHYSSFFLKYQQHKVVVSANYIFPLILFGKFIMVTHNFGEKCYLIFYYYVLKGLDKLCRENEI